MAKYDIEVQLVGQDGNAFAIMGRVSQALRRHLINDLNMSVAEAKEIIDEYINESKSGDYDNLLRVAMDWVEVS